MRLRKASLALGAIIAALARASASDSASAQSGRHPPGSSFKLYELSLSAAAGGGSYQGKAPPGEKLSAGSPASGIPQALPGSKMSRSSRR